MRLLKGGWAARRFQGPALPWAGLLLVLLAASAVAVELLVKGLPANHSLYGDAKARWTINEYADLECPFCKVYTPRLKCWVDSHPDVNLVWRHLPQQMHGEAASHQARLVECAGIQGGAKAFWSAISMRSSLSLPATEAGRLLRKSKICFSAKRFFTAVSCSENGLY